MIMSLTRNIKRKKKKIMEIVILTALGVGASTVFGALLGFLFGNLSHKVGDIILAFGAGVMLSASVLGLILPSLEYGGDFGLLITGIGVILGAILIDLMDKLTPRLEGFIIKTQTLDPDERKRRQRVLLFILAIAIHNIPEGIASGVAFGTGNTGDALMVAFSIALQNIPEGMVIISPMLSVGISPKRAFLYAALTGLVEVLGTLFGYLTVSVSGMLLPLFLSLAGGSMLYVISHEMIPETHSHGNERGASYALVIGFLAMVIFGELV